MPAGWNARDMSIGVAEGARCLLERVQEDAVDVVLLDVEMPEISGLEALQTLRGRYSPIELPIIMVTAKRPERGYCQGTQPGRQ